MKTKRFIGLCVALTLAGISFSPFAFPQCVVPAQGAILKTASYAGAANDTGHTLVFTCAGCTYTLPNPPQSGVWQVWVTAFSTGTVSINPNGVNMRAPDRSTASTATLNLSNFAGTTVQITTDGTTYYVSGVTNAVDYAAATGSAQAQAITVNQVIGALVPGAVYQFLPVAANSAADPTLAVNGLSAVTIKKDQGGAIAALAPGDLSASVIAWVVYDGTYFELLNPTTGKGASPATLTDGATITWSITNSTISNAQVTLGGNRTLSVSGAVAGWSGTLVVKQDATGSRTLTLPAGSKVVNGGAGAITLTTAASAVDLLTVYYDGTNYWWTYGKNFN